MPEDANQNQTPDTNQTQPGQVVTPGVIVQSPQPQPPTPTTPAQNPVDTPVVEQVAESLPQPSPYEATSETAPPQLADSQDIVAWTASEYVAHDKDFAWYAGLALVAVLAAVILYVITRDFVSSGVALFGAFLLGFYGARKPRQLTYELSDEGLLIGEKHFGYADFKKFALVPEGAASSIRFVPHKRFGPPITIFYGLEDEERIVDILSAHLPIEEHKIDAIDRLMRRIRF